MPRYPGASQGCNECRRRRKKCDLNIPACRRCTKAGVDCSGPKTSPTFIHRNATNLNNQSHGEALLDALQKRRRLHVSSSGQTGLSSGSRISADIISTNIPGRLALLALIEDFKPLPQTGIFSGDRISRNKPIYSSVALCIRALLPLASLQWKSLDLPVFSLLSAYMGALRGDQKLAQLAWSSYATALGESRPCIQRVIATRISDTTPPANLQLLFLIAVAFQAFEIVRNTASPNAALEAHIDGVLSVLELSGPQQYHSAYLREAFSGFRGTLLSVSLDKRRPTFLSELKWTQLPFKNFRKTRREHLHDLALQIPALLYHTDRLALGSTNLCPATYSVSGPGGTGLARDKPLHTDYWMTLHGMEQWFNDWRVSEQYPLYWCSITQSSGMVIENDKECAPVFEHGRHQIRFHSSQTAGLLVTYWSFLLELLMGMIKMHQNIPHRQEEIDVIMKKAEEAAFFIFQTVPYLSCCFEGLLASKASLRTLARYSKLRGISILSPEE